MPAPDRYRLYEQSVQSPVEEIDFADRVYRKTMVYWEGDDGRGGGDGVLRPRARGECCASFVAYIVAL